MDEKRLVWGCEVDHILSRKHGGATELSNLALSWARCNRAKGTDIGSVHPESQELVRLLTRGEIDGMSISELKVLGLSA